MGYNIIYGVRSKSHYKALERLILTDSEKRNLRIDQSSKNTSKYL